MAASASLERAPCSRPESAVRDGESALYAEVRADLLFPMGGIRTPGARRLNGFQDLVSSCCLVRLVLSCAVLSRASCYPVRLVLSCVIWFGLQRVCIRARKGRDPIQGNEVKLIECRCREWDMRNISSNIVNVVPHGIYPWGRLCEINGYGGPGCTIGKGVVMNLEGYSCDE
jgi:hypothetical protein